MRAAGLDMVRLAEFAWAKMEPSPGVYDWGWLDRAIATLAAAGLQIILGTPTATPPAWLTATYPDCLRMDSNGRYRQHGSRRHTCPNSPTCRRESQRIVSAMAQRYASHPALIGWQIDNEFGGGKTARCYCPQCAAAFRTWLQDRYGSLAALNEAWGNVFWSQTYSDWTQIHLPDNQIDKPNPSHELDYFRFCSDSYVAYQQEQIDVLRQTAPHHFITHNFMGLYRDLNQRDLAAPLDFATWDNYPTGNPERWRVMLYPPGMDTQRCDPVYAYDAGDPIITGMAHALTRGLKQAPFWVMEQQCGHINWGAENPGVRHGTPRLWVWHAVAEGADAVVYFRWRATLLAHEQYHSGLLRHDASPDVGWADQQVLLAEKDLLDAIAAAPYQAEIALLFDFDDTWAIQLQPHRADFGHLRHLFVYYHALQQMGIPVDVVSAQADLRPYKLLIAPTLHLADAATAARLDDYVQAGGTLLLGVRSGFKTPSNLVTDASLPGALRSLAGVRVTSWQSLPADMGWEVETAVPHLIGPATYWTETLETETAVPLAHYRETGAAALSENRVGPGRVFYLGWYPTGAQATALLQHLTDLLHIRRLDGLPTGVLAVRRGPFTVLLNFTDQPQKVALGHQDVQLAARDVKVAREP